MKMKFSDLFKNRRGSALLVALLVMGVLISISLALSALIFREARVSRDLIDSGQAYYAAESGVELALYGLNENLPGWQPTDGDQYKVVEVGDIGVVEYKVANRCKAFPCFDDDFEIDPDNPPEASAFYYTLDLNQSLTIPLFIVNDAGERMDVRNFTVEFWSSLKPSEHLNVKDASGEALAGWDILRWKILGIENGTNATESISDFTALSAMNDGTSTSAAIPSWFGTIACSNFNETGLRYLDSIECKNYAVKTIEQRFVEGQVAEVFSGSCKNDEAREYYDYHGEGDGRSVNSEDIRDCYRIKDFMNEHYLNYLTLTNLFNRGVLKPTLTVSEKDALSKLYVRVELFPDDVANPVGNETVREFADIKAHGYSGDTKQSVNVKIRKGSFMPVFNFSLYSTYKDGEIDYYGEGE